ncbi:hypothetical protein GDN83_03730 [Gordonia jinghuaiqii]|uniref:Uncharacterized protein n=2 Tax=Gordonia jinghuaiqii TaxID=2758710 RepID=A0A7D7RU57_9ACTN|nr:hypothetical protein [Gordonia jinghuaiqii]QMT03973.1 hypothetical protein H1R19_16595 [Gordonia jinghuaiqii]
MKQDRSRQITWVLAGIAALLVFVFVVLAVYLFTRDSGDDRTDAAPVTVTVTSTPTQEPSPTPAPPPVTTRPAPTGSTPSEGGPCFEWEARSFGTAADGTSLVCNYMGADGGFRWVGHADNDGSVHNLGEPCDPAVDKVAQDPSGKAIMCGGQFWVDGP